VLFHCHLPQSLGHEVAATFKANRVLEMFKLSWSNLEEEAILFV
jgi:hypothetical protein